MSDMHEIIIIGKIPSCPRCRLLTETVRAKARRLHLAAEIRHISYTDEEAAEIAAGAGLKPGVANDVAGSIGRTIDAKDMPKAADIQNPSSLEDLEPDLRSLESLIREVNILDQWLRPFEEQAESVGILMTPVLVIDGAIKHSGSVPDFAVIDAWLSELIKK